MHRLVTIVGQIESLSLLDGRKKIVIVYIYVYFLQVFYEYFNRFKKSSVVNINLTSGIVK